MTSGLLVEVFALPENISVTLVQVCFCAFFQKPSSCKNHLSLFITHFVLPVGACSSSRSMQALCRHFSPISFLLFKLFILLKNQKAGERNSSSVSLLSSRIFFPLNFKVFSYPNSRSMDRGCCTPYRLWIPFRKKIDRPSIGNWIGNTFSSLNARNV